MTLIHSAVLATSLAATVAIGLASAAIYTGAEMPTAPKADRLPVVADASGSYFTIETRKDGVSVLSRVRVSDRSRPKTSRTSSTASNSPAAAGGFALA